MVDRSPTRSTPPAAPARGSRPRTSSGPADSPKALEPSFLDRWEPLRTAAGDHRLRRAAAALLALIAVALAAGDLLRPDGSGSREVITAARDLTPGRVLTADDLTLLRVPEELIPDGALSTREQAGDLTVAGPIRRGEILTDTRLLTPRLTAAALGDVDARIVPIRPADPAIVELLVAGDRVDILAADDETGDPRPIARDALVVLVPEVLDIDERPVLVALPAEAASTLAAASLTRGLTMTLH